MAATRRANAQRAGQSAIQEIAIAQGRDVSRSPTGQLQLGEPDPSKAIGKYAVRPSGLMQSQVEELPGGFKAVYDREGRLVGTNLPNVSPLDATDRAAVNRGEGTVAEGQSLRAAMDKAVRAAQQARPAAASLAEAGFTPLGGAAEQVAAEESAFMPPLPTPTPTPPAPTSPQGPSAASVFRETVPSFSDSVRQLPPMRPATPAETVRGATSSDPFSALLAQQPPMVAPTESAPPNKWEDMLSFSSMRNALPSELREGGEALLRAFLRAQQAAQVMGGEAPSAPRPPTERDAEVDQRLRDYASLTVNPLAYLFRAFTK
jgi:hypothetical protein